MRLVLDSHRYGTLDVTAAGSELTLDYRPLSKAYRSWYAFSAFRSVHNRMTAFIVWRGRTIWIRKP